MEFEVIGQLYQSLYNQTVKIIEQSREIENLKLQLENKISAETTD